MRRVIILDTGPLGLVTNPKLSPESTACAQWLQAHLKLGNRVLIPEIADYEVRREFLRAGKQKGITRLNNLSKLVEYFPINTGAMRKAAELWAQARQVGKPTAGDKTIDGDMILVAQVMILGDPDCVIATTNVGHLSSYIAADLWRNIISS